MLMLMIFCRGAARANTVASNGSSKNLLDFFAAWDNDCTHTNLDQHDVCFFLNEQWLNKN